MHVPVPVHIGYRLPRPDDGSGAQVASSRRRLGGNRFRASALDKVTIDWEKHEVEPRWIESETADCVAALQPGHYSNQGDRERDRFLAGTAERGETAFLISMLGYAHDDTPRSVMYPGNGDSVDLAKTMTVVHGSRLPARTRVTLAPPQHRRLLWMGISPTGIITGAIDGAQKWPNHDRPTQQPVGS